MSVKRPDPVDVEVGHRIRIERLSRGLSQTALANQLGVTFQQVQKYEKGVNRVGFKVAAYDRSRPLVIDPVLSYSTLLGGSGDEFAIAITVDSAGAAYVTGITASTDFPTTPGAFDTSFNGGNPSTPGKLGDDQ